MASFQESVQELKDNKKNLLNDIQDLSRKKIENLKAIEGCYEFVKAMIQKADEEVKEVPTNLTLDKIDPQVMKKLVSKAIIITTAKSIDNNFLEINQTDEKLTKDLALDEDEAGLKLFTYVYHQFFINIVIILEDFFSQLLMLLGKSGEGNITYKKQHLEKCPLLPEDFFAIKWSRYEEMNARRNRGVHSSWFGRKKYNEAIEKINESISNNLASKLTSDEINQLKFKKMDEINSDFVGFDANYFCQAYSDFVGFDANYFCQAYRDAKDIIECIEKYCAENRNQLEQNLDFENIKN